MKKILIVANVISFIEKFNTEIINLLKDELNYEVHVACNTEYMDDTDTFLMLSFITGLESKGVVLHHVPILRSPFQMQNISAYRRLKEIIDAEHFDIIHCHTPVGAMLARLAARGARKQGTKVIYTAHGFHFYKGAPLKNWLLYYPAECLLARWTDVLITINKEDYARAQTFKAGKIVYVPGVGIDIEKFKKTEINREQKRIDLGVPNGKFLLASVGELNPNKNHEVVIRAISESQIDVHYVIVGAGVTDNYLNKLSETLGVADRIHLLGYRNDICEVYKAADVCVFPSIREGLGLAAIEGMAAGLPLIVSDNRGTRCYSENGVNAIVCNSLDTYAFKKAIEKLFVDKELRKSMVEQHSSKLAEYDVNNILNQMKVIYLDTINVRNPTMSEVLEMDKL